MVYSPRIGPDGAFAREFDEVRRRVRSLETKPSGNVVIRETLTTTDPVTGVETVFGQLPDGSFGVQPFVGDTTPPPVATAPMVSAQPGIVTVNWNGLFVANATKPRDFQHVNVIGYKIVGGLETQRTVLGVIRLPTESLFVSTDMIAIGETWVFALESADYNNNRATDSARSVSITMQSVVSDEGVNDALAALDADILAAQDKAQLARNEAAAAQAVVDAILATGSNLAVNGNFDLPIAEPVTGWPSRTNTSVVADARARSGTNVLTANPTSSSAFAYSNYITSGKDRVYQGEMWVRLANAAVVSGSSVSFSFSSINLNGNTIVDIPLNDEGITSSSLSTTDWTRVTIKYTTTSEISQIRFGPRLYGNGNSYLIDGFKMMDVTAAAAAQTTAQQAFSAAGQASQAAGDAQLSADGKNKIWYLDTAPAGSLHKIGDSWFNTANDRQLSRWDGSAWVLSLLGNNAIFPNLDAGKITVGDLDAARLKVKSIGVDKLVVSSTDNLIVEADFTGNGASWLTDVGPTGRVIVPTAGRGGMPALRFTGTTSTLTTINQKNRVVVEEDSRFRCTMWVRSDAALSSDKVRLKIRCYTTATAYTDIYGTKNSSVEGVISANTWTQIKGISNTLPAGTIAVEFILQVVNPNTTNKVDIDMVSATRAADGTLIVDGAINGKTITGALVQTVEDPISGVKIDGLGIRAYAPGNTDPATAKTTFVLDAITGAVTATGIFRTAISGQRIIIWDRGNNLSAIDMFPDGTLQHGALFTEKVGETYHTRLFHFETDGGFGAAVTLQASGQATLSNKTGDASVQAASDGRIFLTGNEVVLQGKLPLGHGATYSQVFGRSLQTQSTTGSVTFTYGAPAPSGIRRAQVTADGVSPVQYVTQVMTAAGFKIIYSGPANNSTSFQYVSYWFDS